MSRRRDSTGAQQEQLMSMHSNYPPQQIVVYTQSAWSRFWGWVVWLGFIVCVLIVIGQWVMLAEYFDTTGGIEEKYFVGDKTGSDKVAIISVEGLIMEGDGFVK